MMSRLTIRSVEALLVRVPMTAAEIGNPSLLDADGTRSCALVRITTDAGVAGAC